MLAGITQNLDEDQEKPQVTARSKLETIVVSETARSVDTTAYKRRTRNPGVGSSNKPDVPYRMIVDENNDSLFILKPNKNGQFTIPSRSLIVPSAALPLKNFLASPAAHTKLAQMRGQKVAMC